MFGYFSLEGVKEQREKLLVNVFSFLWKIFLIGN